MEHPAWVGSSAQSHASLPRLALSYRQSGPWQSDLSSNGYQAVSRSAAHPSAHSPVGLGVPTRQLPLIPPWPVALSEYGRGLEGAKQGSVSSSPGNFRDEFANRDVCSERS